MDIKVNDIIKKLQSGELENPAQLADYLVILSASLTTAGQFELDADITFAGKWAEIKKSDEMTDKMVDALSKQTEEYRTYQQMRINNKTIQETIRALKKKLANLQFEFSQGQNY